MTIGVDGSDGERRTEPGLSEEERLAYRSAIEQVFDFVNELGEVTLPSEHPQLAPLCFHGIEQVNAWLHLTDLGLTYVAEANLRVAMDHMLRAQWYLWTDNAERMNINDYVRQSQNLAQEFKNAFEPDLDVSVYNQFRNSDGKPPTAEEAAKRFGGIYYAFRSLTQAVHPSMVTQLRYQASGNAPQIHYGKTYQAAGLVLASLISPLLYFGPDRALLSHFHDLCARLNIPMDLSNIDKQSELRRPNLEPYSER